MHKVCFQLYDDAERCFFSLRPFLIQEHMDDRMIIMHFLIPVCAILKCQTLWTGTVLISFHLKTKAVSDGLQMHIIMKPYGETNFSNLLNVDIRSCILKYSQSSYCQIVWEVSCKLSLLFCRSVSVLRKLHSSLLREVNEIHEEQE